MESLLIKYNEIIKQIKIDVDQKKLKSKSIFGVTQKVKGTSDLFDMNEVDEAEQLELLYQQRRI